MLPSKTAQPESPPAPPPPAAAHRSTPPGPQKSASRVDSFSVVLPPPAPQSKRCPIPYSSRASRKALRQSPPPSPEPSAMVESSAIRNRFQWHQTHASPPIPSTTQRLSKPKTAKEVNKTSPLTPHPPPLHRADSTPHTTRPPLAPIT